MPKSRRSPTCAWLMRAGIFRSPNELRRIVPAAVAPAGLAAAALTTGLAAADRPSDADCGDTGGFGDGEFECDDDVGGYGVREGEDDEANEMGDANDIGDAALDATEENVGENAAGSVSK